MATTTESAALPKWYWLVAVFGLLWMAFGCFNYLLLMTMSPAEIAQLPPAQQEVVNTAPVWVNALYAIAVWSGLGGAIGLVLRRAWARLLFLVSLAAVILQFGWIFTSTSQLAVEGPSAAAFPLIILLFGIFFVWFAGYAQKRGWIA
jgi:hypothetical protein